MCVGGGEVHISTVHEKEVNMGRKKDRKRTKQKGLQFSTGNIDRIQREVARAC